MTETGIDPASYRDPAGFVFQYEGKIYRQVQEVYAGHYNLLMQSGLYAHLQEKGWLLSHTECTGVTTGIPGAYRVLQPQPVPFISYPYEWSFDMLRDAALLTLDICSAAVSYGMILKDATSFNIQFISGRPVFIDTLSFEQYDAAKPWVAYRQFCEMFLFPLYLGYYLDTDVNQLLCSYIDGIPAAVTAKLLPVRSRLNLGVWLHVHLQLAVKGNGTPAQRAVTFSQNKLLHLLDHLRSIINGMAGKKAVTGVWGDYYKNTILSRAYLEAKEKVFRSFLQDITAGRALDLGANDGYFSRIAAATVPEVIATDADSQCINRLYAGVKENQLPLLPLIVDLCNPSPGAGFNNSERKPFLSRAASDLVIALALIHHLAFSKHVPLAMLAGFLHQLTGRYLIIEFVPLEDEKVQQLIRNKTSWHLPYDTETFEQVFSGMFEIEKKEPIENSSRILYRMKKK